MKTNISVENFDDLEDDSCPFNMVPFSRGHPLFSLGYCF